MPLFDMPATALDNVYAQSAFELAEAQGGQSAMEHFAGELDEIVELTRQDADFSEFLASQLISTDDRERSLRNILQGRVSDLMRDFILVLNRKGRLARLLSIANAYQTMLQERFGVVEVNVYTRHPIEQVQREQIRERLQQSLDRTIRLYDYIDPQMIGGIKMQIGDRLYDDSFRTMLRQMRELFKTEGASLIKAKGNDMIEGTAA